MSEPIEMPPEEYRKKRVAKVDRDGQGWLVQFGCGDSVWSAVEARVGDWMYCAVCLERLRARLRAKGEIL